MFFSVRLNHETDATPTELTAATEVEVFLPEEQRDMEEYIRETVRKKLVQPYPTEGARTCRRLVFRLGIPNEVKSAIEAYLPLSGNPEEYALLTGEETVVCAQEARGLLYGLATLCSLQSAGELTSRLLYDYPDCAFRGYRMFLPGRVHFDNFRDLLDLLVAYKYNTIILEIGGAMEYRKHPEIETQWKAFCREVHSYNGRADEIQHKTYPWVKDSIHCDNGDGDTLTQEECRYLASLCRARGLEVIPECPTLSHADYLVQPHPAMRERAEDAYADTYCPNAPGIYALVFDVLDEVIEVFRPRCIHIGHDEYYSVGVCPRCAGKDPVDLFVGDIERLHRYLSDRGIRVMMWGDKLLNARNAQGEPQGGAERHIPCLGQICRIPALYPSISRIPKDIQILHWYWIFDEENDLALLENGLETIYGNLEVSAFTGWRRRIGRGIHGGVSSNWGSIEAEYMQRNQQIYQLMYNAYVFFSPDYDDDRREELRLRTMEEAYRLRNRSLPHALRVVHRTDAVMPYVWFYDGCFIDDATYLLGHYVLEYADGTSFRLPVKYGTNISRSQFEEKELGKSDAYRELCGGALPTEEADGYWYETTYADPRPGEVPVSVRYEPAPGKESVRVDFRLPELA